MFCCAIAMLCYDLLCFMLFMLCFCYDFTMFSKASGYSSHPQFQIHNAVGVTQGRLQDVPVTPGSRPGQGAPSVTGALP